MKNLQNAKENKLVGFTELCSIFNSSGNISSDLEGLRSSRPRHYIPQGQESIIATCSHNEPGEVSVGRETYPPQLTESSATVVNKEEYTKKWIHFYSSLNKALLMKIKGREE